MLLFPIQFSAKVTKFALDLPSLFKETTLSLPRSVYRYGTIYMYVPLQDNYKKTSCHIP